MDKGRNLKMSPRAVGDHEAHVLVYCKKKDVEIAFIIYLLHKMNTVVHVINDHQ